MTPSTPPMHQLRTGEGRPLMLVHGVGGDLSSWAGVVAAMGPGFDSIRYDLRGHGRSPKLPGPYAIDDFAADLGTVADNAGWDRFDLAGFSLGALIAQAFALAQPRRLRRLVLISGIAGRTAEEREASMRRADDLARGGASTHLETALSVWFTDGFRASHPEVVAARVAAAQRNDPAGYAASYRVLAGTDFAADLHRIATPTLVMTGGEDRGSTPRMARLMGEGMPDARVEILPGLRHSILLEAPERVAALMRDFLSRPDSRG